MNRLSTSWRGPPPPPPQSILDQVDDDFVEQQMQMREASGFRSDKAFVLKVLAETTGAAERPLVLAADEVARWDSLVELNEQVFKFRQDFGLTTGFSAAEMDHLTVQMILYGTEAGLDQLSAEASKRGIEHTPRVAHLDQVDEANIQSELVKDDVAEVTYDHRQDELVVVLFPGTAVAADFEESVAADLAKASIQLPPQVDIRTEFIEEVAANSSIDPCERDQCHPARGGTEIKRVATAGFGTIGFPVTRTDISGVYARTTAGHFGNSPLTRVVPFLSMSGSPASTFFTNEAWQIIGTNVADGWYNNTRSDTEAVQVPNYLASDLLFFTPSHEAAYLTGYKQQGNIDVGDFVYLSGGKSGVQFGVVTNDNRTVVISGVTIKNAISANYSGQLGDSGAPIVDYYNWSRLLGSHSGGTNFTSISYLSDMNHPSYPWLNAGNWALYFDHDLPRDFIVSLYARALNRLPDAGGYAGFRALLNSCNVGNAQSVVWNFYLSPEFLGKWPIAGPTDGRYEVELRVEALYRGALRRAPDAGGLDAWSDYVMGAPTLQQRESRWVWAVQGIFNSAE